MEKTEIHSENDRALKKREKSLPQTILRSGIISWIIVIGVWGLGSLAYDEYFLPSPKETLDSLITLISNGTLIADIIASLGRIVKGWLLAAIVGIPLGLLVGNFKPVRWLIEPILSFIRFVPAIALTTLFLMWFGVGEESKVALIFYASFFPVFVNTIAGVATADQSLIEAASCMGAKKIRVFFTVIVPSAAAYIFTGVTWQYTPLEAGHFLFSDASKFYSSYISAAQRLPNGNTLITEGSDGRLIEVTPDHEIVWEYINPYFNKMFGKFTNNMIYRAYRVPYEWIPQLSKPEEISVKPIDVSTFRVPGSVVGAGLGKITVTDGVDPNKKSMTGGGGDDDSDEKIDFCVASVNKKDIK